MGQRQGLKCGEIADFGLRRDPPAGGFNGCLRMPSSLGSLEVDQGIQARHSDRKPKGRHRTRRNLRQALSAHADEQFDRSGELFEGFRQFSKIWKKMDKIGRYQ
jgi:hypothetical protein